MKLCPNCKTALDDNARFCLCCMTSLDEKQQVQPPVFKARRWPLVLLCSLLLCALLFLIVTLNMLSKKEAEAPVQTNASTVPQPDIAQEQATLTQVVDGVRYSFRPATESDHPTALNLDNYYVLIRVEGTPSDGIYRVPTFVGNDTDALVTVVADNAFAGTYARVIDLGYNVRYVWGNAFGGYPLTDLYLHEDVLIDRTAFSGCTQSLTIHCPEYLENTEGALWSDLAVDYGFRWQPENF